MAKKLKLKNKYEPKTLLVKSKIIHMIHGIQLQVSVEFFEELEQEVTAMIYRACSRCQQNHRNTVMGRDI